MTKVLQFLLVFVFVGIAERTSGEVFKYQDFVGTWRVDPDSFGKRTMPTNFANFSMTLSLTNWKFLATNAPAGFFFDYGRGHTNWPSVRGEWDFEYNENRRTYLLIFDVMEPKKVQTDRVIRRKFLKSPTIQWQYNYGGTNLLFELRRD